MSEHSEASGSLLNQRHFSLPCMYIAARARAYANEMLMRLGRSLEENFEFDYLHKTMQPYLMCFKEIILG